MRIMLFGSRSVSGIPNEVKAQLAQFPRGTEFIVGDASGVDSAFHAVLSELGHASFSTVYCMGYARSNRFKLETKIFDNDELKLTGFAMYNYKDTEMCNDCDMAICIWDGDSNGTFTNINMLKAREKQVYVWQVARGY